MNIKSYFNLNLYNKMQNSMMSKPSSNLSNNTSLSASNKKQSSYLQRYQGKKQQKGRHNYNSPSYESTLLEDQLINRTQKVIELCNRGEDISDIKIEEDHCESEYMRNQFLQTELLWFKMIDETKHQILQVRQLCQKESKNIRDVEKEMTEKRNRLTQLTEKLQKQIKQYQIVEVETYVQEIQKMQEQYDSINSRGVQLLQNARQQRDQLLEQKQKEEAEIQQLQRQIKELCEYQDEAYNTKLAELLAQQNKLQEQIFQFQQKIAQTQKEIRSIETRNHCATKVVKKLFAQKLLSVPLQNKTVRS